MNKIVYKLMIMSIVVVMLIGASLPFIGIAYTQRYITDNNETATKGIWFQKTVYLKEYKHLGVGNSIFGEYSRYSRSDRHEDVLTIYKER